MVCVLLCVVCCCAGDYVGVALAGVKLKDLLAGKGAPDEAVAYVMSEADPTQVHTHSLLLSLCFDFPALLMSW
jgi:hypothetical protein